MSAELFFDKAHIDDCLKAVAKQYRKLNKKGMPAEITLVGGASILINYGFRDSTYDVDALIQASSSMKDAISFVTDTMELPNGWLNDDFRNTDSYTPRLTSFSRFYRTFSNVVTVRTIAGEYLIAMKLKAFRKYKHDVSDIVGILCAHTHTGNPLDFQKNQPSCRRSVRRMAEYAGGIPDADTLHPLRKGFGQSVPRLHPTGAKCQKGADIL